MSTNVFNPSDRRDYPDRWPRHRGKELFTEVDSRCSSENEELLSVSHITGITPRSQKNVTMFQSESLVGYKICEEGDIVANTMWTWQGAIGVSQYHGVVSPAYNVYRQKNNAFNPIFLDLLLREPKLVDVYHSISTGIRSSRLRLYPDEFLTIDFPVPPREEQDQIVRFLDWKVSSINRLILTLKKKISLLEDLRDKQFQIVQSSSKRSVKIKQLFRIEQNWIDVIDDNLYSKIGMYNRGRGIFLRSPIEGKNLGESKFQTVQTNCVMLSGQFAWEGAVYITQAKDTDGVASHRYYLLKANSNVPVEYLWAYLVSDYGLMLLNKCSHGAAGRNKPLNIQELLNEYVSVPVIGNDLSMLVQIVRQCMQARNQYPQQLEIYNELKSVLISDVVTGKIDVRNVVIPEYEYTPEEGSADGVDDEELEEEENDNV